MGIKRFTKTFSLFSDVCFAVKPRSTENVCNLTGKSLTKFRKPVYGKISRKPFSKKFHASAFPLCSLSRPASLCSPRATLHVLRLPHSNPPPLSSFSHGSYNRRGLEMVAMGCRSLDFAAVEADLGFAVDCGGFWWV